jgi:16S rRNA (adenine1518-N6/adenine1519-N6)-dimethyltransferase
VGQRLGQHFLVKESILERIARAACPERVPLVIEIGPGRGALTANLLERADRVVAIELDPALASFLREKYASEPRLEIVEADVLAVDLARFGPAPVVGNLPYYITSPILARVVRLRPARSVFLIQDEVADRLAAKPGNRDYGFLTVSTSAFAAVRKLFTVKPGAFRPPPKVDSAVIELVPAELPVPEADVDDFIRFVGECFEHKRKTLRNNLARSYPSAGIDSWPEAGLRAEQIPLEIFARLFRRIVPESPANQPLTSELSAPDT